MHHRTILVEQKTDIKENENMEVLFINLYMRKIPQNVISKNNRYHKNMNLEDLPV